MKLYMCDVCGYVYDPEVGDSDHEVASNTEFEDLPENWICPLCHAAQNEFSPLEA